ncbi:hypothetical protein FALBO_12847 [Fusarium albosuccineum]|uniref:Uncharacterized protein n=1 Tax=Fusarium albosuccineum TaxID=1237068 RepID=A0A8H4L2D4_9HYPO|nr:hypothetical protein FALBO_12847 [Fusarium albosuccineum]
MADNPPPGRLRRLLNTILRRRRRPNASPYKRRSPSLPRPVVSDTQTAPTTFAENESVHSVPHSVTPDTETAPVPFAENESVHSDASAVSRALPIGEHSFMASSGRPASLDRFDTVGLTGREDTEEVDIEQMDANLLRLMTTEGPENSDSKCDEVNSERGEVQVRRDQEPDFRMKQTTSERFRVLLSVNGQLVPGYHAGTVARLGRGLRPGLQVYVCITAGQFSQPALHIQLFIRQGRQVDLFLDIIIPLATILDTVTVTDVSVDDQAALATLHAFQPMDLSGLMHRAGTEEFARELANADLLTPAAAIACVSPTVRQMRVNINWSQVFLIESAAFKKDLKYQPAVIRDIVQGLHDLLSADEVAALQLWFLPEISFETH